MLSGRAWKTLATIQDNSTKIAGQQAAFKKAFKVHYLKRLRKNHHMATDGKGQFAVGDIVLLAGLSASKKQPPFPALGII